MKNVYDGVATLDRKGQAEVRLPAWFQSLNRDFRYQLTAIGRPAPDLHVSQTLRSNRFRIAGGRPGMKVSWQITGVRQDRWAKANPLVVEKKKQGAERGRYLHPKAFAKAAKLAIHASARKAVPKISTQAESPAAEAD